MAVDLDPSEDDFDTVRDATLQTRDLCEQLRLTTEHAKRDRRGRL